MVTMERLKKEIGKKEKIFLGAVLAVTLFITTSSVSYILGARSQETRIKNLNLRLATANDEKTRLAKRVGETVALNKEVLKKIALWEEAYNSRVKELNACEKKVAKLNKPPKQTGKRQPAEQVAVAKKIAPTRAIPKYAAPKPILRINVVEWSPVFGGKSLHSREIGSIIRQGLADGTIARTKETLAFLVNNVSVSVQNGDAIVDPGAIVPETVLVVRPVNEAKFILPPGKVFPLVTGPEELDAVIKRGVSEIWMNFILAQK